MDINKKNCSSTTMSEIAIKPDLETLRAYSQAKLTLAGEIRVIREGLVVLGRKWGEQQCGELVVKLAEDRFTLAVLGQFKRGKSSLMNAIIGRELLPTGVLPLTSAITVLKYGPSERLVIRREDRSYPDELPVSSLADYVTEQGNPSNTKKVKTATVELPVLFLRRGVEFVDTPGVGSAITANTATTYGFLPECDAVLFVTSVDTPMTSMELEFLKDIREYVDRIFFVVNKTDLVADDERNKVMQFVAETIQAQTGRGAVKVFPVSARQGLAARTSDDAALYEQSGLKALEEALASFLSKEKAATILAVMAHKALRIVDDEAAQGIFLEEALQARTKELQNEKAAAAQASLRDPHSVAAAITEARTKIEALNDVVVEGRITEVASVQPSFAKQPAVAAITSAASQRMVGGDLPADLRTRGCPVCKHIAKQAWDFFTLWQYRLSTDKQAQAEFAAEHGFCPLHTWQLLAVSSPHGASIGYAPLAEEIARRLRMSTAPPSGKDTKWRLVRDSHNCRICELLREAERKYVRQLAALIDEKSGRGQYRNSQGACLRHLDMLIDACSQAETREFLLSHAVQRFEEDAEDMRSFALKHEAIRRALQNRNESDAYRRAIIRIVGDRRVCVPWDEDGEI